MKTLKVFVFIWLSLIHCQSHCTSEPYKLIRISKIENNNWFVFKDVSGEIFNLFSEVKNCTPCDSLKVGEEYLLNLSEIDYLTNVNGISNRLEQGLFFISEDSTVIEMESALYESENIIDVCFIATK
ncbi:MAG: hypothetical protein NXI09_15900 [Bacteroidetes bacterium]|nr:hypothetical protein [Bacteroidota bacterium]